MCLYSYPVASMVSRRAQNKNCYYRGEASSRVILNSGCRLETTPYPKVAFNMISPPPPPL